MFQNCFNIFRSGISVLGIPYWQKVSSAVPTSMPMQRSYASGILGKENSLRAAVAGTMSSLCARSDTNLLSSSSGVMQSSVRSIIRVRFPRAKEHKRLGKHGYAARIATPSKRQIIMRRILKGRHSLWHG